jgi:hypothetical protein
MSSGACGCGFGSGLLGSELQPEMIARDKRISATLLIGSLSSEKFATGIDGNHSTRSAMHTKLVKLQTTIENAIRGMSSEDFARRLDSKWTAAEILEHLSLTYIGTAKNFEKCIACGRPGASGDRRSKRLSRIVVSGLGFLPSGRKSPGRVCPRGTPVQQVKDEIMRNLARMDTAIFEAEARFGREPLADHPALGPLTASEWRSFHLVHGKHHAKQILRLRQSR